MQHYAHYTATRTRKTVTITTAPHLQFDARVTEIEVSGKKEARDVAARYNAICWNF